MGEGADAATKLNRVARRAKNGLDRRAVDAFALEGAVEVDDMQPFEALLLEGFRLRRRILVIDRRRVHLAELQADALAILQIDGGKEDLLRHQGFQRKKFAIRARPRVWLFSGWNCVPTRLPSATIAVTGPP